MSKLESWNAKPLCNQMECYFYAIKPMRKLLKDKIKSGVYCKCYTQLCFQRRGPCLLCPQTGSLNAYWKWITYSKSKMEITGIVSLKLSLFLLKMKRTIQLLGDSHSSILLPYALSLSSPKHNSSITFQIPPHSWLSTSFLFSSIASHFSNVFQPSGNAWHPFTYCSPSLAMRGFALGE